MKRILFFTCRLCVTSIMLFSGSCSEFQEEEAVKTTPKATLEKYIPEVAYPGETGLEKKGKLFGEDITYTEINGEAIFEGDIVLSKDQLNADNGARTQATGVSFGAQRWTDGIVPYTIDQSLQNTAAIQKAIEHIQFHTPIRFVYRSNQYNYVTFKYGQGFSSSIGMKGGQQFITLGLGFGFGGVLHEICHTLGLFHEHTRDDRDQTIAVHYENIATGMYGYFRTHKQTGSGGFGFDKMDLGSVMMMDSYYGSRNGLPTMTENGSIFIAFRSELSVDDVRCLNAMYSNVYLINSGILYAGDARTGMYKVLASDWDSAQTMTAGPDFLYAARNGSLQQVNPLNADVKIIATGYSQVRAMVLLNDYLYVINNGVLLKVNRYTGASTKVGTQLWPNAADLVYSNGLLYILTKDGISKVSPETGSFAQLTNVAEAKELVALNGFLYYIKTTGRNATGVYKVNPLTGLTSLFSPSIAANAQMVAFEGSLYISDFNGFYKVQSNGTHSMISSEWWTARQLVARNAAI